MARKITLILNFFFNVLLSYECSQEQLLKDLLVVEAINEKINDRLPVTHNHFLQGGYINMPSARMSPEGTFAFGYSWIPPYRVYGLLGQLTDRIEVTGNYRIFTGVDDPILSPCGFGDLSDKGVNFKWALVLPEDTDYRLPGFAIGFDDILGTRNFKAKYVVATQVFLDLDCELSLGYGTQRIHGFFGGLCWIPWRKSPYPLLQGLRCVAEYDGTPYKNPHVEKHPKGRNQKTPFNLGLKYTFWDYFTFSTSYVRGTEWAYAFSVNYNFGHTVGFIPKFDDALPYNAPVNFEPIGSLRPPQALAEELYFAFQDQGLNIMKIALTYNECLQKELRITIINPTYRVEACLKERLIHLLAALIPEDVQIVTVIMDAEGFPFQEYVFDMNYVGSTLCRQEIQIITPAEEYSPPCSETVLLKKERYPWNVEIFPRTQAFFGSSSGKFKYAFGLNLGLNGYLPSDVYYSVVVGMDFISNLKHCADFDRLNPSQIINVRSDIIRYYQQDGLVLNEAFLQKNWNLGNGWYSRLATGYLEIEYGGIGTEFLYYPVNSNWAFGLEGALLLKRNYSGLGFTDRIRKFEGRKPTYKHFIGSQFFLALHHDWRALDIDVNVFAGKFLANDWGARLGISKYFPSGLIVYLWTSYTNGKDTINDKHYHDMGVGFSMPLDIFYTHSTRERWGYSMSAWLRDVGVAAYTGRPLYESIREQRQ